MFPLDTIKVDLPVGNADKESISAKTVFESYEIVQLEANNHSLIGSVDRIASYKGRIIILDRMTNSVFIFDSNGNFVDKIHRRGKGPGEYVQVTDFSIDRQNDHFLLLCDIPYKIIKYDFNGTFIEEYETDRYYPEIMSVDGKIILTNINPEIGNHFIYSMSETGWQNPEEFVAISDLTTKFHKYGKRGPNAILSNYSLYCAPLENTIYELTKTVPVLRYFIDFGQLNLPRETLEKSVDPEDLFSWLKDHDYGYFIGNIRETQNYLFFTVRHSIYVIYDKRNKSVKTANYIDNALGNFEITHLFGHDGTDNMLFDVIDNYHLQLLKNQLDNGATFPAYNSEFLSLIENFSVKDNPVIIKYFLK